MKKYFIALQRFNFIKYAWQHFMVRKQAAIIWEKFQEGLDREQLRRHSYDLAVNIRMLFTFRVYPKRYHCPEQRNIQRTKHLFTLQMQAITHVAEKRARMKHLLPFLRSAGWRVHTRNLIVITVKSCFWMQQAMKNSQKSNIFKLDYVLNLWQTEVAEYILDLKCSNNYEHKNIAK